MDSKENTGLQPLVPTESTTVRVTVSEEVKQSVLAREARSKDSILAGLNALARESVQEEPDFGLSCYDIRKHSDPFAAADETVRARRVSQVGVTTAVAPAYPTQGNSVIGVPIHPQREGRIETVRAPVQVAIQLSGDVEKEIASLTRQGLRPVNIGDTNVLFASVHTTEARSLTHADVKGMLVQLYVAQLGLQGGYRPSTRGRVGYDVRLVDATDRQRARASPALAEYKELVIPPMPDDETGLFLTLCGPHGVSNYLWTQGDPDNPQPNDLLFAGVRNYIPGGERRIIAYNTNWHGRRPTLGGRAIFPGVVRRLLERLETWIPGIEMREAALDAAVYSHVYPSPVPDVDVPERDQLTGARFTGQYPAGAAGVVPVGYPPPEPGIVRRFCGDRDLPDRVGQVGIMPIPSALAWVAYDADASARVEQAVWRLVGADLEWDPLNTDFVGCEIRNNVMELSVNRHGLGIMNPRWRHRFGDRWVTTVGLVELVDGGEVAYEDARAVFLSSYSPERVTLGRTPNNELVGNYRAYRNLFQAVDAEQRLSFPTFDMVHVAGVLTGTFHVRGARGGGGVRHPRDMFVAMHGVATNFAHFWSRAISVRKIDPQLLVRESYSGGPIVLGIPYGYQSVVYPDNLTAEAYPWGSWEHLEVAPLIISTNNTDSFVGFGTTGRMVGDSRQGWLSVMDSDIAFVDAWVRAVASASGMVPLITLTTTPARFIYHLHGNDRFAHPFCTPVRVVRRVGVRADLLVVGPSGEDVRLQTAGVFPFDPFTSTAPAYVARRVS